MSGAIQTPAGPEGALNNILTGSAIGGTANTPEEKTTLKDLFQMLAKAKQWKNTWYKDVERWRNLWESNHNRGRRPHTLSQAVINQVWSAVETFAAHISDSLPEPICRARSPEYRDHAKLATKWLRYVSDRNDLDTQSVHWIRSAAVTGAGWFAVEWDPAEASGQGDVVWRPVDDAFMFPAPYATNYKECEFIAEARNVPREWVVRNFEKGFMVEPGVKDPSLQNIHNFMDKRADDTASPNVAQFTATDGSASAWVGSSATHGYRRSDLVTFIRVYIRQADGHMRLVEAANEVILSDGPSPYGDDDFPYVVVNLVPTLDTMYGRSLVQFIEGLQDVLNNTMSYLLDQQRFCSDPMLVVDAVNLEDGQLIDNSPGSVLPNLSPNGVGYSWLQAPGFNQAWLQIHEVITTYMDSVLGRVDVLKGEHPAGVDTLGGLEIIRDEANVRLRSLTKFVKASLKRAYKLTLSRLRQFATGPRQFRIDGQFGQDDYVDVNPVVGVRPDGQAEQEITLPDDAEFELAFGQEQPGGRQARMEEALTLLSTPAEDGLPVVDRQYVLERLDIEEAPEIMERLTQVGQQMAQAQAKAEGQPEESDDPMDQLAGLFQPQGGGQPGMEEQQNG